MIGTILYILKIQIKGTSKNENLIKTIEKIQLKYKPNV